MGGQMTYQRMRNRNGLMFRKPDDDPDPYWRSDAPGAPQATTASWVLIGDLNRMERDYLATEERSLAVQCSEATGIDQETVQKVLRYVFLEQP